MPRLCLKTLQSRRITSTLSDEKDIFLAPVSANHSRIRRFQTEPSVGLEGWRSLDKFAAVIETVAMNETDLSEY